MKDLIEKKELGVFNKIKNFLKNLFRNNKQDSEEILTYTSLDEKEVVNEYKMTFESNVGVKNNINYESNNSKSTSMEKSRRNNFMKEYYKKVYSDLKNNVIDVSNLSPNDFMQVIKMQRIEYEFTQNTLKGILDKMN